MNKLNNKIYSVLKNIVDYSPLILELSFYIGVFYVSARLVTLWFGYDTMSLIPPDETTTSTLLSNNGIFLIPTIVLLVITTLLVVFLPKKSSIYIIKAFILDIMLTILSVKFCTTYDIVNLKDLDCLVVFALMITWGIPLGLAAFAEHKQRYSILKNLLLFLSIVFIVFFPSLIQNNFARDEIFSTIVGAIAIYILISYIISLAYSIKIDTEGDSFFGTVFFVNTVLPVFLLFLLGTGLFSIIIIIFKLPLNLINKFFHIGSISYIGLSKVEMLKLGLSPIYIVFVYVKDFFVFRTLIQFISSFAFLSSIFVTIFHSPKASEVLLNSANLSFIRMVTGGLFIVIYIMGFQSVISTIIRIAIAGIIILSLYLYYRWAQKHL